MAEATQVDLGIDAGKSPEQLLAERTKRFHDVEILGVPDRIPSLLSMSYMVSEFSGMTKQEYHDNPEKAQAALEKAAQYFQPDAIWGPIGSPDNIKYLGDRSWKYPGYGLGPNDTFQFVEDEYMKADDYDAFLTDQSDWGVRVLLPRLYSKLGALSKLGPLAMTSMGGMGLNLALWATPEGIECLDALKAAGAAAVKSGMQMMESTQRLAGLGFPPVFLSAGSFAAAPFDALSDGLRGMKGIMLDMHRRPDKLLEAVEKMRVMITRESISMAKTFGFKYCGSMLHRGSDGFMSLKQFEKFYWPSLKQMWLDQIEAGITPYVFYEGCWDQRLEYLQDLPKGKTVGWFQSSDIYKVKEKLGDVMCIQGGMPNSMLTGGTVEQIRAHTRKLCEVVGKDGGFIMGTQIGEMEGSEPELVKAWMDATKEFGQY